MDGTVLGLLTGGITIIFGVYSIWAYRKTRKKVSLYYSPTECYRLFRDDISKLNIDIGYKNEPLKNNLIILRATLFNDGQVDIDKNKIHKPIKLVCSQNFKWLESNITDQSDGVSATSSVINHNEILLEWELLKVDEYIDIETLVEIINPENIEGNKVEAFYKTLNFDYRITDLKRIKDNADREHETEILNLAFSRYFPFSLFFLGLLLIFNGFIPKIADSFVLLGSSRDFQVEYLFDNGKIKKIGYVDSDNNNEVILHITEPREEIKLSFAEFQKNYKVERIEKLVTDEKISSYAKIFGVFLIGIGFIFYMAIFLIQHKRTIIKD